MDSDHSSYSSMNKSMAESETATAEESGWTSYFEDFMAAQQKDHHQNHSFTDHYHHHQNHSFTDHYHHHHHHHHHHQQQHLDDQPVVSDAVSHVEWNYIDQSMSGAAPKFPKKLNLFKKTSRRTREILYDDSLEDTASSPVNSPKVGSQQMGFNQIKVDDIIQNSLEKGGGFDGHLQLQKREDQSREMVFDQDNNNGNTDLRKRGLCLVPLSMLANYI
ncbi:vascular-related unknown protein 1-like [Cynara cardunculus var. scolymus]|uniref:vascular-related unknown protein 1-like n=1 Tax=Cynara cardunculus var. scolymus TaxID=59895 RepID=UPI000D629AC7|nr:vascular-related unknown protein 1-like [Cynara cardunculus var. scolymus]